MTGSLTCCRASSGAVLEVSSPCREGEAMRKAPVAFPAMAETALLGSECTAVIFPVGNKQMSANLNRSGLGLAPTGLGLQGAVEHRAWGGCAGAGSSFAYLEEMGMRISS